MAFNEKPTRKIYNNGSIAVLAGPTKLGLIKLRKIAYKTQIETIKCPF